MTFRSFVAWLRGDGPQYVANWTYERARRAERDTLKMLGRGETAYLWSRSRKIKRGKVRLTLVPNRKVG